MPETFLKDVMRALGSRDAVVRVVITKTQGSTPRNAGAAMLVWPEGFSGTIGGGRLEYLALAHAREMLSARTSRREGQNFVLGTELRQCCGGVAWLLFELFTPDDRPFLEELQGHIRDTSVFKRSIDGDDPLSLVEEPVTVATLQYDTWFLEPARKRNADLYLYGAGHVGRALVQVMQGTPFDITWVDVSEDRFPDQPPEDVSLVISDTQWEVVKQAPAQTFHAVMTFSHQADLEICRAVMARGDARYLGLIASDTKRAKFMNRLRKDGLPESAFEIFHAPIGLLDFKSKEPAVVAISIAAQLMEVFEREQ